MPPTFFLVFGLVLLGLIVGPVLAAGLLIASLVPASRGWALPALRFGLVGAVAGLVVDVLLHLAVEGTLRMMSPEGLLVSAGAGFALGVIARGIRALALSAATDPDSE